MESEFNNNFYNVATGKGTSLKNLAETLLFVTNSNLKTSYSPRNNITLVKNRVGCHSKAMNELNFVAKIDLINGLKDLVKWRKIIN